MANNNVSNNEVEEERWYIPLGYQLCLTDEILIQEYLRPKVYHGISKLMYEVEIYGNQGPNELTQSYRAQCKNAWYFFTQRERKYANGCRPSRIAGDGHWRAVGKGTEIKNKSGQVIGLKRSLAFVIGKHPNATKTPWLMHEYTLIDSDDTQHNHEPTTKKLKRPPPPADEASSSNSEKHMLDGYAICKIYISPREEKKNQIASSKIQVKPTTAERVTQTSQRSPIGLENNGLVAAKTLPIEQNVPQVTSQQAQFEDQGQPYNKQSFTYNGDVPNYVHMQQQLTGFTPLVNETQMNNGLQIPKLAHYGETRMDGSFDEAVIPGHQHHCALPPTFSNVREAWSSFERMYWETLSDGSFNNAIQDPLPTTSLLQPAFSNVTEASSYELAGDVNALALVDSHPLSSEAGYQAFSSDSSEVIRQQAQFEDHGQPYNRQSFTYNGDVNITGVTPLVNETQMKNGLQIPQDAHYASDHPSMYWETPPDGSFDNAIQDPLPTTSLLQPTEASSYELARDVNALALVDSHPLSSEMGYHTFSSDSSEVSRQQAQSEDQGQPYNRQSFTYNGDVVNIETQIPQDAHYSSDPPSMYWETPSDGSFDKAVQDPLPTTSVLQQPISNATETSSYEPFSQSLPSEVGSSDSYNMLEFTELTTPEEQWYTDIWLSDMVDDALKLLAERN